MLDYLVPILTFVSVVSFGAAIVLARSAGHAVVRKRLRDIKSQSGGPSASPPRRGPFFVLSLLGRAFALGGPSATLARDLARAGFHGSSAPTVYMGFKLVLLIAGVAGSIAMLWNMAFPLVTKAFVAAVAGVVLSFLPNLFVQSRRRRRTSDIRQHLPDTVDLLEICVSSGMGMDMAWNSVAEEIRHVSPVMADEMALTNLEIHLGAQRAAALRHMAERTGAEEISSLVALLVQSERFGTKISDTLKTFAESMREERGTRAQETAEKMAVKLLLPMALFIFPAVMIVLVGPAAIRLYGMIGW